MGITLRRGTGTGDALNVTSSGFFRLRLLVAKQLNQELGEHYEKCFPRVRDWDSYEQKLNEIIERYRLEDEHSDILDFLFASDTDGMVDCKTCRKILDLLNGVEDESNYGYAMRPVSLNDIKNLMQKCVKTRRPFVWH